MRAVLLIAAMIIGDAVGMPRNSPMLGVGFIFILYAMLFDIVELIRTRKRRVRRATHDRRGYTYEHDEE